MTYNQAIAVLMNRLCVEALHDLDSETVNDLVSILQSEPCNNCVLSNKKGGCNSDYGMCQEFDDHSNDVITMANEGA